MLANPGLPQQGERKVAQTGETQLPRSIGTRVLDCENAVAIGGEYPWQASFSDFAIALSSTGLAIDLPPCVSV
jgi:hypothetical protein